MASKKSSSEKGGASKAEFIRSLPSTTPASEVVAKAKAAGMSITPQYVYNLRARANVSSGAPKRGPGRPRKNPLPASAPRTSTASTSGGGSDARVEDLLRAVAAEIGLSRAIGILQTEQQKVRAVFGR